MTSKKEWSAPNLVEFGSIQDLTLIVKDKQPGSRDDFGVTGISDA